jgi:hypothetical protein
LGTQKKIYGVENPVGSTIDSRPHCLSTVFFNVTDVDLVLDIRQLDNCKHSAGLSSCDDENSPKARTFMIHHIKLMP